MILGEFVSFVRVQDYLGKSRMLWPPDLSMISDFVRKVYTRLAAEFEPLFTAQNRHLAGYQIGEWTYGTPKVRFGDLGATLTIGRFCSISRGVVILLGGEHHTDWITTYPFNKIFNDARGFTGHPHTKGDVVIGHDVWIGQDVLILSGVAIGNGAVIGARAVVARDVKPYSIVAGNPAQHIRFRFTPDVIDALQRVSWWDWPIDKIKEAWPLLMSPNVEEFIGRYGRLE
jgi:acetyltransferase-like isoleucine patch superfamily enzyme